MAQQKETARAAGKFGGGVQLPADLVATLRRRGSSVTTAWCRRPGGGRPAEGRQAGGCDRGRRRGLVILDATPFYAESGGQVGDQGVLAARVRAAVVDTLKLAGQFHGHVGTLNPAPSAKATGCRARRCRAARGHRAQPFRHAPAACGVARRGHHVQQKGSLVAPDRLRFDFSHFQPVTDAELAEIERRSMPKSARTMRARCARWACTGGAGLRRAMALFGEKYGEEVRVRIRPDVHRAVRRHPCRPHRRHRPVQDRVRGRRVRRRAPDRGGDRAGALDHGRGGAAPAGRRQSAGQHPAEAADKLRTLLERQKKLERELSSQGEGGLGRDQRPGPGQARDIAGIKGPRGAPGGLRRQGAARCDGSAEAAARRRGRGPGARTAARPRWWPGQRAALGRVKAGELLGRSPVASMARAAVVRTWPRAAARMARHWRRAGRCRTVGARTDAGRVSRGLSN